MNKPSSRMAALFGASAFVLFSGASCSTMPQISGDVESLERQSPATDVPNTGDTEYIQAAERYSNPRSRGYNQGYHGNYGHGGGNYGNPWRY